MVSRNYKTLRELINCGALCLLTIVAACCVLPGLLLLSGAQRHDADLGNARFAGDGFGAAPRSPKWPSVRAKHLKAFPACAVCGCTKGVAVHHVEPFHIDPSKELDPDNLITLGEECPTGNHHLLFGHLGDWKSYNTDVRNDAATWRRKMQERP